MKKLNIKKSFKTKKFKYGAFSTITTIVVLAALLVINVAASKLNFKKDLTQEKIYSITDQSKNIVKNLKNNINIIAFYETGKEDPGIKAVLEKYKTTSNKISVEYKDPTKYPTIVQKYTKGDIKPEVGSVVVESSNKYKVIEPNDFFNETIDSSGNSQASSFTAEQQLTNAIIFVNSEKQQVLYTLTGHEEEALSPEVSKQLDSENYLVKDINLIQGSASLTKDSMLVVDAPKKDLSKDETEKIKAFLSSGGRAAFFMDITKESLPNFQDILSSYGVKLNNAVVIEGQTENTASSPAYLLPNLETHDILNAIKSSKSFVLMPLSQPVEILKTKKSTTTVEALLTTTSNSWGKVNLNATTISKEKGDLQGPFNIAVAITDVDSSAGRTTKLIVTGNGSFMNSDAISATNGTNLDFAINSLNWLQDKKDSVSIRPKDLTAPYLIMNDLQKISLSGVVVILIPLVVMIIGIVVWHRRRHR